MSNDFGDFGDIELAEAVRAIRSGLTSAAAAGAGEDLAFDVGDIALEFTVELRRDAKAGGKVKAWIVEAGADASQATARTHKVAFTLTPRDRHTGEGWKVGNDRPAGLSGFGGVTPPGQ
ncbi:trypco2 family protein [Streptomyces cinnamoneus]|uniref:trypco2 family protein n=1 Tax=Streptomyces cinnamoneus TaxID=53446 RepID=UPI00343D350F